MPSGGVVMTCALRAAEAAVGDRVFRLASATTIFPAPIGSGALVADVQVLHRGGATVQTRVSLRAAKATSGLELIATFVRDRKGPDVLGTAPPAVRALADSPSADDASASNPHTRFRFYQQLECRIADGDRYWADGFDAGPARYARWFRYKAPQRDRDGRFDRLALPPLIDTMPTALHRAIGPSDYRFYRAEPRSDPLRGRRYDARVAARRGHDPPGARRLGDRRRRGVGRRGPVLVVRVPGDVPPGPARRPADRRRVQALSGRISATVRAPRCLTYVRGARVAIALVVMVGTATADPDADLLADQATRLEQAVERDKTNRDAPAALEQAIALRAALGDDATQLVDVEHALRWFPRAPETAAELWAATPIYERRNTAALVPHLRRYLATFAATDDPGRVAQARVRLAMALVEQSCSMPLVEGLCVARAAPSPAATTCGSSAVRLVPAKSDARLVAEARDQADRAAALATKARGRGDLVQGVTTRARTIAIDLDFEAALRLPMPNAQDTKALERWITERVKRARTLGDAYSSAFAIDHAPVLAPIYRRGQVWEQFAADLAAVPIPDSIRTQGADIMSAYCSALEEQSDSIIEHAREVYRGCVEHAVELGWDDEWTERCAHGRARLDPAFAATRELVPVPDELAPPTQPITPATASAAQHQAAAMRALAADALPRASFEVHALEAMGDTSVATGLLAGVIAARRGAWPVARMRFDAAVKAGPTTPAALVDLALVELHGLDDVAAAATLATIAPAVDDYELDVARGIVARQAGHFDAARAAYEAARRRDPQRSEAAYDLGVLYKEYLAPNGGTAAYAQAAAAFREAAALSPASDAAQLAVICDKARASVTPPPATK